MTDAVAAQVQSPVHTRSAPTTRWSTVNYAEAIQGVQTPLGWTFWDEVMERSLRRAFGQIGVLTRAQVAPTTVPDERTSGCFYGYVAGNVSLFRLIGDAMPGTTADALVEQMFGERRPAVASRPTRGAKLRYPVVAVKLPLASWRNARALPPARRAVGAWWRRHVIDSPPTTIAAATAQLSEATDWFCRIGTPHTVLSMVGQAVAEQVELLAQRGLGSRERAADLMTGYGSFEETVMLSDLVDLAGDRLEMAEFLARHGYHGPDEGAITSRVWREDPTPVHRLVERYRSASVADPSTQEATRRRHREEAERELRAGLGVADRARAEIVLRLARALIPMREIGKAGFLHAVDAGRCSARVLGTLLTESGRIDDPEDVFYLTLGELRAGIDRPVQDLVATRRADHARFQAVQLSPAWTGNPEPTPRASASSAESGSEPAASTAPPEPVTELRGIGITGTAVTGRARVIHDPADADLDPGDVLVCRTTDPSWTPLFLVAEALVIDTGGPMSHGAIVARELGVPCVINTGTGTRDIPDGATITVDGTTGVVTVQS